VPTLALGGRARVSLWCGAVGFGAGMSSLFAAAVAQLHGMVPGGMSGRAGGKELWGGGILVLGGRGGGAGEGRLQVCSIEILYYHPNLEKENLEK
jgi:hypothetical protein